jgi:hypothetical protein
MPDISFDPSGFAKFPTKYHGDLTLSKHKWEEICAEPERWYYKSNGDKIATLINPDVVRFNKTYSNQFIYYKEFQTFSLSEGVAMTVGMRIPKYLAVVIDISSARVCTIYPVQKPKQGNEYTGD